MDVEAILGMVPMSVSTAPCFVVVQLYVAFECLHGVDVDRRVVLLEKGRAVGDISVLSELSLECLQVYVLLRGDLCKAVVLGCNLEHAYDIECFHKALETSTVDEVRP